MLCLCKCLTQFWISRSTLHVRKYLPGCRLTLYIGLSACVLGGGISESREGQECVWSSCRLLHQTGIAGAVHIPPVVLPAFLHTPTLNILLWKNPLRRYRPLPLHTLKISSRDHLYTPPCSLAFLLYCYHCCTDAVRLFSRLFLFSFSFPWVPPFSSLAFVLTWAVKAASRSCSQPS